MSARDLYRHPFIALAAGLLLSNHAIATVFVYEFDAVTYSNLAGNYGTVNSGENLTGILTVDDSLPLHQALISIRVSHATKGTVLSTGGNIQVLNDYFVADLVRYFGNTFATGSLGGVSSNGGITLQLAGPITTIANNDLPTDLGIINALAAGEPNPGDGVIVCLPAEDPPRNTLELCDNVATIITFRLADTIVEIEINGGNPLHPHHDGSDPNPSTPRGELPDDRITVAVMGANTGTGDPINFDATQIDPSSVRFGPNAASDSDLTASISDVDNDGNQDATFDFKTSETGINCGESQTSATLYGTADSKPFNGTNLFTDECDAVCHN
jgi:hypothetical protein